MLHTTSQANGGRLALISLPTPFEPMDRLSRHLGGPRIWAKRDDCTTLGGGGNKSRKLEFLMAEALRDKADTVSPPAPSSRTIAARRQRHLPVSA